jgi:hypothetical protein
MLIFIHHKGLKTAKDKSSRSQDEANNCRHNILQLVVCLRAFTGGVRRRDEFESDR